MPYKYFPQDLPLEIILRILGYTTQKSYYDMIGIHDEYTREVSIFGTNQVQTLENVCQTWKRILSFQGHNRDNIMMHICKLIFICFSTSENWAHTNDQ